MNQSHGDGVSGKPDLPPQVPPQEGADREPGWAHGLRKLYNSVVDEPLPDSFRDLLKKLDGSDDA